MVDKATDNTLIARHLYRSRGGGAEAAVTSSITSRIRIQSIPRSISKRVWGTQGSGFGYLDLDLGVRTSFHRVSRIYPSTTSNSDDQPHPQIQQASKSDPFFLPSFVQLQAIAITPHHEPPNLRQAKRSFLKSSYDLVLYLYCKLYPDLTLLDLPRPDLTT